MSNGTWAKVWPYAAALVLAGLLAWVYWTSARVPPEGLVGAPQETLVDVSNLEWFKGVSDVYYGRMLKALQCFYDLYRRSFVRVECDMRLLRRMAKMKSRVLKNLVELQARAVNDEAQLDKLVKAGQSLMEQLSGYMEDVRSRGGLGQARLDPMNSHNVWLRYYEQVGLC
jgi:ABC-type transporter Mla subunit MlaD